MVAYLNQVTIASPRNGTTSHTISPSSGTVVSGTLFTPTAGRFLVCVATIPGTFTNPTGWTRPIATTAGGIGGYLLWKYAAGGAADNFTVTATVTDVPAAFSFFEFPAEYGFPVNGTTSFGSVASGVSPGSLSGQVGLLQVFGVAVQLSDDDAGTFSTFGWNTGTEIVDTGVGKSGVGGVNGYALGITHLADQSAASYAFIPTLSRTTPTSNRILFSVGRILMRATTTSTSPPTTAVDAINPAASNVAGDLGVVSVVVKPYSATVTTPAGYTLVGEATNGTVASGPDTGSVKVLVFARVSPGGNAGILVQSGADSMTSATTNFRPAAGYTFDFANATSGSDTTDGTTFAATGAADIALAADDFLFVAEALNNDAALLSAVALSTPGIGAPVTSFTNSAPSTVGNQSLVATFQQAQMTGASTGAPSVSNTLAAAGSGAVLFVRLRPVVVIPPNEGTASGAFSFVGAAAGRWPPPALTGKGLLGSGTGTTAGTTVAVVNTTGAIIPAGTLIHITGAWDNIASVTAPTVTCSTIGGATAIANHATAVGSGVTTTAGAGIWHQCFRAVTTGNIASGATIATLTSNQSAIKRAAHAEGWANATATLRGTVATGTSITGSPTVTTTGTALVIGDLVIGSASFENNVLMTADADTAGGAWPPIIGVFTTGSGAATNVGTASQFKILTATGTQTFNPTGGVADTIACVYSVVPTLLPKYGNSTNGTVTWAGAAVGASPAGGPAGSATGALSLVGAAAGKRTPKATTTGAVSFVGAAAGTRTPKAAATGAVSFVGAAVGAAPAAAAKTGSATGAITWVGAAAGTRTPKATSTGALSWVGAAAGSRTPKASSTGALTFVGAAAGKRTPKATATGAVNFVGAAAGARSPKASSTGALSFVGAAAGSRTPKASATGAVNLVGAAAGKRVPKGTASTGAITWAGTAAGVAPVVGAKQGSSSGIITWAGAPATGVRTPKASSSGAVTWVGAAAGKRTPKATGSGTISWTGTAAGTRTPKATATGAISWVGLAAGTRAPKASSTGTITWAGTATGTRPQRGASTGAITWAGSAAGKRTPKAATTGTVTWTGLAAGKHTSKGVGTGAITWTGIAAGVAPIVGVNQGSSAGQLAWVGNTTGLRRPIATSTGAITWLGAAAGKRVQKGTATGAVSYSGSAAGRSAPFGTASGTITWLGTALAGSTRGGQGTGTITWLGEATGTTPVLAVNDGTAVGALTWAGEATGTILQLGTASGAITWTATAVGIAPAQQNPTLVFEMVGPAWVLNSVGQRWVLRGAFHSWIFTRGEPWLLTDVSPTWQLTEAR